MSVSGVAISGITPAYDHYRNPLGTQIHHPLLYKISNPEKTHTHYVLGVRHDMSLTYMPPTAMQEIKDCTHLFAEVITSLPIEPLSVPHHLSAFLNKRNLAIVPQFEQAILPLLTCFGISEKRGIDWLPTGLLDICINLIIRRIDKLQPGMDEALICAFKEQNKPITMLRENLVSEFTSHIQQQEEIIAKQSVQEKEKHLLNMANRISNWYAEEKGERIRHSYRLKEELFHYLHEDLNQTDIQKKLLEKNLVSLDRFFILQDNEKWVNRLVEKHHQTEASESILFACGYAHLISAENKLSVLDHLRQRGFQVEHCDEVYFEAKRETKPSYVLLT